MSGRPEVCPRCRRAFERWGGEVATTSYFTDDPRVCGWCRTGTDERTLLPPRRSSVWIVLLAAGMFVMGLGIGVWAAAAHEAEHLETIARLRQALAESVAARYTPRPTADVRPFAKGAR